MKKCTTIAILNQKGGVGKTTTTYNLGWELGKLGKKVLLVDLDSQGNLTMQAGTPIPDRLETTIANLMFNQIKDEELPNKESLIIKKEMVDVLPANIELSGIEAQLVNATMREFVLDSVLEEYKKEYDYILIDCMPSLLMLPINALATCDKVIIPVALEFWPVKGLEALLKSIAKAKKRMNTKIAVSGILITKYNPNLKLTKVMEKTLNDIFGKSINIFDAKILNSIKVAEAGLASLSVSEMLKTIGSKNERQTLQKISEAYESVAKEIIASDEKQRGITNE